MEITSSAELEKAIEQLHLKASAQKDEIKLTFNEMLESLKPANLLKSAMGNISEHQGLATSALGASVGLGAGVLSKKLIVGKSKNIFKKILGIAVEFAVARGISSNAGLIAQTGIGLLKKAAKNMQDKKIDNRPTE